MIVTCNSTFSQLVASCRLRDDGEILETVDMVKMLVRQGPRPSPPTILATLNRSFNFSTFR